MVSLWLMCRLWKAPPNNAHTIRAFIPVKNKVEETHVIMYLQ